MKRRPPRIVMIGAGSAGFCKMLVEDILHFESLRDAQIVLMDIDSARLDQVERVMDKLSEQESLTCSFSATTDLTAALTDADFAISMIQVGGLEPYKLDIEIPLKYGIDQCIGDTLNPGGLFRGLRHIAAFMEMLAVMERVCPGVLFMNYSNPMAICSWAKQKAYPHIQSVGLCHGVQHTTAMLCRWLAVEPDEVDVLTAGINHMAWFLECQSKGQDLYPLMWQKLEQDGPISGEEYRFEMMKAAGFFMTESPGHLSEYLPYFRHRKDLQALFGGPGFSGETGAYLRMCLDRAQQYAEQMANWADGKEAIPFNRESKSVEYAADIINAVVTGIPFRFAGNVLNKGFISNLPFDCCVEVPVFADRQGLHGSHVGRLPEFCASLCLSNIAFQELAVKAGLNGDIEAGVQACMLDPLTSAVLAPHEIRNLMDEMFAAQLEWLPQFQGKTNESPGARIGRIPTGAAREALQEKSRADANTGPGEAQCVEAGQS
jgi:alpha-galactosidase